jgi:hypothetical protein
LDTKESLQKQQETKISEGYNLINGFGIPKSPRASEIIKELLSRVTHGFASPKSHRASEIINELLSRVAHGFGSPKSLRA